MASLSSGQRKFLCSKAHHLKPLVLVGKQGLTDTLVESVNVNLEAHELIKVRFTNTRAGSTPSRTPSPNRPARKSPGY